MVERPPTRLGPVALRLGEVVRAEMPDLVERVTERIVDEIPVYQRGDVVSPDQLRESVRRNVDYIVAGLTGAVDPDDLRSPAATGRARAAQGAPLVDMLSAFRIAFHEA